jgi:hypothetical protein
MAEVDEEPSGYRCQCGHIRLEHVTGGKLCMVTGCGCKRFRAMVRPMTIHGVSREADEFNQDHEAPASVLANGGAGADEPDQDEEARKATYAERAASIERNRSDVLKEFAKQEAELLEGVRAELAEARAEVAQLEAAEARIMKALGLDSGRSFTVRKGAPDPLEAGESPAGAKPRRGVRKARAAKPAADGTFQAKLVSWVVAHPKSTLDDIAQAFPKEKRATISSRLYLAKKAQTLKTTGTRGSMKWSGA